MFRLIQLYASFDLIEPMVLSIHPILPLWSGLQCRLTTSTDTGVDGINETLHHTSPFCPPSVKFDWISPFSQTKIVK